MQIRKKGKIGKEANMERKCITGTWQEGLREEEEDRNKEQLEMKLAGWIDGSMERSMGK